MVPRVTIITSRFASGPIFDGGASLISLFRYFCRAVSRRPLSPPIAYRPPASARECRWKLSFGKPPENYFLSTCLSAAFPSIVPSFRHAGQILADDGNYFRQKPTSAPIYHAGEYVGGADDDSVYSLPSRARALPIWPRLFIEREPRLGRSFDASAILFIGRAQRYFFSRWLLYSTAMPATLRVNIEMSAS